MKRFLFRFSLLVAAVMMVSSLAAQEVRWAIKGGEQRADSCRVELTARIPNGFHMYDMGPYKGGPTATSIVLTAEGAEVLGAVEPLAEAHREFSVPFNMEIGYYEGTVKFAQWVRLTEPSATVKAAIEWMICDARGCQPPSDLELTLSLGEPKATTSVAAAEPTAATPMDAAAGDGSLWTLLLEAIVWGFAALLTPCVFPMVPMTVSYFLKGEGGVARGRMRAALYGIFIVALYTLPIAAIILITRFLGGDTVTADIFNWLATPGCRT